MDDQADKVLSVLGKLDKHFGDKIDSISAEMLSRNPLSTEESTITICVNLVDMIIKLRRNGYQFECKKVEQDGQPKTIISQ